MIDRQWQAAARRLAMVVASGLVGLGPTPATTASATDAPEADPHEAIVARWGDEVVTCGDLRQFAAARTKRTPRAKATGNTNANRNANRNANTATSIDHHLLEDWVVLRQLVHEARALKLDRDPAIVQQLERQRDGLAFAEQRRVLAAAVVVTEADVVASYRANRGQFKRPERIATRLILARLAAEASPADVQVVTAKLQRIKQEAEAGAPFGQLARLHSDAENGARGGAVAASPRGSLLAAYEAVAWQLETGEISDVVRLPDGLALILKEKVFPASDRTLAQASKGIRERLRRRKLEAQELAALDEAKRRWPAEITWQRGPDGIETPTVKVDGQKLDLTDLGLEQRPPRLRERVQKRLERWWRVRLARERAGSGQAKSTIDRTFSQIEWDTLASAALARRVAARLSPVPEAVLRGVYDRHRNAWATPERRAFDVLFVAGEENKMRAALATAQAGSQRWQTGDLLPFENSIERWGPLPRSTLGNSTSPRLAAAAFNLTAGGLSAPLRLERYSNARMRYEPEGYVVLELVAVEPPRKPTFEEARERSRELAARDQVTLLESAVREEILNESPLHAHRDALAACQPVTQ